MNFSALNDQISKNIFGLNSELFDENDLDFSDEKLAYAERYGGDNIGNNGGGGRVLDIGNVQLKGVGANLLVGIDGPESHTYGGLDAQSAIKEVIFSNLINRISPVGAQESLAILLIDKKRAIYNGTSSWSVILVREKCLRPAHWMSAGYFEPSSKAMEIESERSRIVRLYKEIGKNHSENDIKLKLENFLFNCAQQYAFCRIARIFHSVASASNLSIEGKLLDVSESGFVTSGYNFSQLTSFFSEPALPLNYLTEILHLLLKYNQLNISEAYLQGKYNDFFIAAVYNNLGFIFGMDEELTLSLSNTEDWRNLSQMVCNLITANGPEKIYGLANIELKDYLSEYLSLSLFELLHSNSNLNSESNVDFKINFINTINRISKQANQLHHDELCEKKFIKLFIIQTLKRSHLSSFFYVCYISKLSEDLIESGNPDEVEKVIDGCDGVSEWIFESLNNNRAIIFQSQEVSLIYTAESDEYILREHGEVLYQGNSPKKLYKIIRHEEPDMSILHYNFTPFTLRLLSLLAGDSQRSFNGIANVF